MISSVMLGIVLLIMFVLILHEWFLGEADNELPLPFGGQGLLHAPGSRASPGSVASNSGTELSAPHDNTQSSQVSMTEAGCIT